jgi:hypothetical protein
MREGGRFHAGRGLLTAEGLCLGVLGGVALAWSVDYARFGADGMPLLGLKVTPTQAIVLMAVGALALIASLGRWPSLVFSAAATCGWAGLAIVCALEVAHHAPGLLGFDHRDRLFYGALSAYNLLAAFCSAFELFKVRSTSSVGGEKRTVSGRRVGSEVVAPRGY